MGEAKDREAAIKALQEAEQKRLEEECERQEEERKRQEELQKLLATPLSKEEAEKALADSAVEAAQLLVARQKLVARQDALRVDIADAQAQIDMIDVRLQEGSLAKSIVYRRALNPQTCAEGAAGEVK